MTNQHRQNGSVSSAVQSLIVGGGVLILMLGLIRPVQGQHIIDRYLTARFLVQAREVLQAKGRAVPVLSPERHQTAIDSLWSPPSDTAHTETEPPFVITERRVVQRLERAWFQKKFGDTKWAFLGANSYLTPLDTTFTPALRARLEAQFGPPTRTLADLELNKDVEDYIQFEYWFVVNDTIPAIVMDVHGPYDRGLIVATDRRLRSELPAFRRALLAPVLRTDARKPYVDYFYDREVDTWYRTGYDGADFFLESVRRSQIIPGRRPWLESVQTAQSSSSATSSE